MGGVGQVAKLADFADIFVQKFAARIFYTGFGERVDAEGVYGVDGVNDVVRTQAAGQDDRDVDCIDDLFADAPVVGNAHRADAAILGVRGDRIEQQIIGVFLPL